MPILLKDILSTKLQQMEELRLKWLRIRDDILDLFGVSEPEVMEHFSEYSEQFEQTLNHFIYEISNPKITLATTGTTSSGKSSLVNLLCGAEIMPVGVQEMSAGLVMIDHHPTKRRLKIPSINGLSADFAGEWSDISDDSICTKLRQVMDGYRRLRESNPDSPMLHIHIQYPIRFGLSSAFEGLSSGFQLRIVDIPGFRHISDSYHLNIIRNEVEKALSIVTYNSEDPDSDKQFKLLDEVVRQINNNGGSPSKMMFVLNRIDVFKRDQDWELQTQAFIKNTKDKIKAIVKTAFPQYKEKTDHFNVCSLSTYPALCACKALHDPAQNSIKMLKEIYNKYSFFLKGDFAEGLTRNIDNWTANQQQEVAEAVWRLSLGYSFDLLLKQHIFDNIFSLLPFDVDKIDNASFAFANTVNILKKLLNISIDKCGNKIINAGGVFETTVNIFKKLLNISIEKYENEDVYGQIENFLYDLDRFHMFFQEHSYLWGHLFDRSLSDVLYGDECQPCKSSTYLVTNGQCENWCEIYNSVCTWGNIYSSVSDRSKVIGLQESATSFYKYSELLYEIIERYDFSFDQSDNQSCMECNGTGVAIENGKMIDCYLCATKKTD